VVIPTFFLLFFVTCSFILRIVYSVLHIFVLLPHVANKLNQFPMKTHFLVYQVGAAMRVM